MISKELLNEVFNENVYNIELEDRNVIRYYHSYDFETDTGIYEDINIHELGHKCKEWAKKNKGYAISSDNYSSDDYWRAILHIAPKGNIHATYANRFDADTEPEAIFKACEWILDNKE